MPTKVVQDISFEDCFSPVHINKKKIKQRNYSQCNNEQEKHKSQHRECGGGGHVPISHSEMIELRIGFLFQFGDFKIFKKSEHEESHCNDE
jgi:hypothetical protein